MQYILILSNFPAVNGWNKFDYIIVKFSSYSDGVAEVVWEEEEWNTRDSCGNKNGILHP